MDVLNLILGYIGLFGSLFLMFLGLIKLEEILKGKKICKCRRNKNAK